MPKVELINFKNVIFRYENRQNILSNFSFSIYNKNFFFITGESGAGKTTFLKLIYSAIKPIEGKIAIFGTDISLCSSYDLTLIRKNIGIVFQDKRLFNHLNVLDNVALMLHMNEKKTIKHSRELAREILDWVGLRNHYYNYPCELSDGQQQRVTIARAVIAKPLILLADEATGNLDDLNTFKMMKLFIELYEKGTTVLCVTHNELLLKTFQFPKIKLKQGRAYLSEAINQ